ncbi:MAG: response regulator transcription factor [Anaerolineae bacterium]
MSDILIVDDEIHIARCIERLLSREHQVQVSHCATEALGIARNSKPDLLILDVRMPGMGGLQLCRELRSDPGLKGIAILLLSGSSSVEDKIKGFEAGADDYLAKPFEVKELLVRVRALLRRATSPNRYRPPSQFSIGKLTLNSQNCQLYVGRKTVSLTPIEFDLMYHLMSAPDRVFSGEQLLEELWDYPSDTGSPDLVRMHIRNLRRKIEPDCRNPRFILTVPRHGYTVATE